MAERASWTLRCVPRVVSWGSSGLTFQIQAHIVKKAASASCSDGPFTTYCSAHLEDNSDASIDLAIHDPSKPHFTFLYLT
jgi:hypothetical protein